MEIFDVAATVVRHAEPDLELPTAVRRTGVDPIHVVVDRDGFPASVRDAVADLLGGVAGTVGVIAAQSDRDAVAAWIGPMSMRGCRW